MGADRRMSLEREIARRFEAIEQRIAAACERVGRPRSAVTLIGASKMQSVETLRAAWESGLRIFGENRVQEAETKAAEMPTAAEWHLIGPLQSNKARRAVALFTTIHSIDRLKIARAVDRVAGESEVTRRGLLEVNLGEEETKHGFRAEELLRALPQLTELQRLELVGLMAIPPFGEPEESRPWFRQLRQLGEEIGGQGVLPHWRGWLSMGMSGDFEVAIEEGATHVRVGTSLFGARPTAQAAS